MASSIQTDGIGGARSPELCEGQQTQRANPQDAGPPNLLPQPTAGPDILLAGEVTDAMARDLHQQLADAPDNGEILTVEVTTLGGDAEFARRMICDIDIARKRLASRRLVFVGKTIVYSAGVTIMSAFPRRDRFLTGDTTLLIHCRQLQKTVEIDGPIRSSRPKIEALLHQIDIGIGLETQNFERLIEGSDIPLDELLEKALYNWYLPAREAQTRGLVEAVLEGF